MLRNANNFMLKVAFFEKTLNIVHRFCRKRRNGWIFILVAK